MKNSILLYLFLCLFNLSKASNVDTIKVYSNSMKKFISVIVVTPNSYNTTNVKYPVVYMLHGYSNAYNNGWINRIIGIRDYADQYKMLLVMPDGGFSSWYFDSPVDSSCRYETFITKELVTHIDVHYNTINRRQGRAITGNSMGGHGAFYLAFRHQDIFGAAGSTSGGVDFRPFPNNWDIYKRLGKYAENKDYWENNTVINMTHLLYSNNLSIIFDCGTEDFFYKVNCALHEKLMYLNIQHEFISRPGNHGWSYWQSSINSHLYFFNNYFVNQQNNLIK